MKDVILGHVKIAQSDDMSTVSLRRDEWVFIQRMLGELKKSTKHSKGVSDETKGKRVEMLSILKDRIGQQIPALR